LERRAFKKSEPSSQISSRSSLGVPRQDHFANSSSLLTPHSFLFQQIKHDAAPQEKPSFLQTVYSFFNLVVFHISINIKKTNTDAPNRE
jgi:hypothetical protein